MQFDAYLLTLHPVAQVQRIQDQIKFGRQGLTRLQMRLAG